MELILKQSGVSEDYDLNARGYLSICFFLSLSSFILTTLLVSSAIHYGGGDNIMLGPIMGVVLGITTYFYFILYPKLIVSRRVRLIEQNLLFALRGILIQIRSGVPIFDTLVTIAAGDYGPISDELKQVVEKVNAGQGMVATLEDLAVRNPSIYFRRTLWQLVNSLKSGSDVGDNLHEVIESLSKEQLIEIRKYKSVLNPLAMMYMIIAVIMPTLGITLLIIVSAFPGMEDMGNERTFWALLVVVIVLQVIFMGLIKSKRPNLLGR